MWGKLATSILIPLVDWAVTKLSKAVGEWIRRRAEKERIERKNAQLREKAEKAVTKQEREDAVETQARHF